jgi:hypothetical protein
MVWSILVVAGVDGGVGESAMETARGDVNDAQSYLSNVALFASLSLWN